MVQVLLVDNIFLNLEEQANLFNSRHSYPTTKEWWKDSKCQARWIPAIITWLETPTPVMRPISTSNRCKLKSQEWRIPLEITQAQVMLRILVLVFRSLSNQPFNNKTALHNTLAPSKILKRLPIWMGCKVLKLSTSDKTSICHFSRFKVKFPQRLNPVESIEVRAVNKNETIRSIHFLILLYILQIHHLILNNKYCQK